MDSKIIEIIWIAKILTRPASGKRGYQVSTSQPLYNTIVGVHSINHVS